MSIYNDHFQGCCDSLISSLDYLDSTWHPPVYALHCELHSGHRDNTNTATYLEDIVHSFTHCYELIFCFRFYCNLFRSVHLIVNGLVKSLFFGKMLILNFLQTRCSRRCACAYFLRQPFYNGYFYL